MTRIDIPAALRGEIAADLAAGGERAARWRPGVETDHEVLIAGCTCDAPTNHDGHVGPATHDWLPIAASTDDAQGWTSLSVDVPQVAQCECEAVAWAPVGGVDDGPRPGMGDRVLVLRSARAGDGWVGHVSWPPDPTGPVKVLDVDYEDDHPQADAVTQWALLPPEIHTEHHDDDMYELAIRIPMSSFTGPPPNDDPRIDQVIDLTMDLFPAASATGGFAWPEDGPSQCPTCGAVDRAERRHRAHEDAEATLRELVRWLAGQRDRAHDQRYDDYGLILGYLRDQGLDVDYLAEPDTREQT